MVNANVLSLISEHIVRMYNVRKIAMATEFVILIQHRVFVTKDSLVHHVNIKHAPIIAMVMEYAFKMDNAYVMKVLLEKIVDINHAIIIVMVTELVLMDSVFVNQNMLEIFAM